MSKKKDKENDELPSKTYSMEELQSASYDELSQIDEKDIKKAIGKEAQRSQKKIQLTGKLGQISLHIKKLEQELVKSYTDPNLDSVEKEVELLAAKEELRIASEQFQRLFPDEAKKIITLNA